MFKCYMIILYSYIITFFRVIYETKTQPKESESKFENVKK